MNRSAIRRAFVIVVPSLLAIGLAIWLTPKLTKRVCPRTPATEQDYKEAERPGVRVFEVDGWDVDSIADVGAIAVHWNPPSGDAFASSHLILLNCGYSDADVASIYSEDMLRMFFGGVDSREQTATCESNGVTLREFDLVKDGQPFKSRMWVERVSETRVRDIRIDFPADDPRIDEYAARLYPDLVSCEA